MGQGYKLGDQVLRHALVGVVDTVADDSAEAVAAPDPESPAESDEPDTGDNADTSGE
jgi:molecular chaperone GrpE